MDEIITNAIIIGRIESLIEAIDEDMEHGIVYARLDDVKATLEKIQKDIAKL